MHTLEITCAELYQQLQSGEDVFIIDCRESDEHAIVSIAAAKLIPMGELPDRLAELEPHRDRQIVVHCHKGGRSLRAAHWLREQGFNHAQSLAGGIDQWAVEIEPGLARY